MLLIDMHAEGVESRPLKQMSGASEFGEVFFTDVRVPEESILGPVGKGWEVAMVLLSFERGSSAIGQYTGFAGSSTRREARRRARAVRQRRPKTRCCARRWAPCSPSSSC